MQDIVKPFNFELFNKALKTHGQHYFCELKKMIHVYLEKSSTIINAYDFPPILVAVEGPNKSI